MRKPLNKEKQIRNNMEMVELLEDESERVIGIICECLELNRISPVYAEGAMMTIIVRSMLKRRVSPAVFESILGSVLVQYKSYYGDVGISTIDMVEATEVE